MILYKVLDHEAIRRIACPLCKAELQWSAEASSCPLCGQTFRSSGGLWSFQIQYPEWFPTVNRPWKRGQDAYEEWADAIDDDYERQLKELDEVREIYTEEFALCGSVLDVGGNDGRLRHYLPRETVYFGIDPYPALQQLDRRPNLRRVYPVLNEPCYFLRGTAEHLPFAHESFDFVHMRSVLDHLADPFLALCEARRVLNSHGGLMIGIHVTGGKSPIPQGAAVRALAARFRKKVRDEGIKPAAQVAFRRIVGASRDEHLWHPSFDSLLELVEAANFGVEKTHWQKPPNEHVVYLMARKN